MPAPRPPDLSAVKARAAGVPFDSESQQSLSMALACCIVRARGLTDGSTDPENHIYWHTREACYPVSRELGLLWSWVMLKMPAAESESPESIRRLSAPFWPRVVHPDVLARDVMET